MALNIEAMNDWNDGGPSKDDFTARTEDGYTLRAEKMYRGSWWWQVYTPNNDVLNAGCDLGASTEYSAKGIACLVYKFHSRK